MSGVVVMYAIVAFPRIAVVSAQKNKCASDGDPGHIHLSFFILSLHLLEFCVSMLYWSFLCPEAECSSLAGRWSVLHLIVVHLSSLVSFLFCVRVT